MIVKINYVEHYDGGLTINKVLKIKMEKVKPMFDHIRWFPYARIYRKTNTPVNWRNKNIKGVQYVYLFNTDITPNFIEGTDNDRIYKHLVKMIPGYLRDLRINEIFED